jgi:rod shape determining protein RodA
MKNQSVTNNLDWISVFIYITLVVMGWLNIYSSSLSLSADNSNILDLSQFYGKQLLSIGLTVPLIFIVLAADGKFYEKFASIIFVIALLSLAGFSYLGKP